jgi:hypothetical protein
MGKLKFGVLFFVGCVSAHAQELTLNQFLKSALDDGLYKSFASQDALLQDKSTYSLPWVNKVQALYQDNQFNNYQTRYTLRFYAGNPFQIQRNKQYFLGYQSLKNLEQKLVLKEILRDRYELVIEFWMASEVADVTLTQKKLREKIGNTMEQMVGSSQFKADDYLNTQLSIIEKAADWQEKILERDIARSKILTDGTEAGFELRSEGLVGVNEINQFVQHDEKPERTEYNFLKQRAEVSDLKMKLEKSNFDIGYLQTMYGSDRRIGQENTIGLAFGVALPIINPNKEDIAREKLTTIERKGELEQFQQQEAAKLLNSKSNLKLHLDHYQKVDSLIQAIQQKQLNLVTALSANYDPLIELKYQEKLVQLDLLKLKIKKQILLQYISFLDNEDKLHQRPLVNYLSKSLESLEN